MEDGSQERREDLRTPLWEWEHCRCSGESHTGMGDWAAKAAVTGKRYMWCVRVYGISI